MNQAELIGSRLATSISGCGPRVRRYAGRGAPGRAGSTLDHLRQGETMDHQQEHEFHHKKEREREKHREKEAEREEEKSVRTIHPAWFVVLGVLLIVLIVLSWTFFF
jgi:hypothetical protein